MFLFGLFGSFFALRFFLGASSSLDESSEESDESESEDSSFLGAGFLAAGFLGAGFSSSLEESSEESEEESSEDSSFLAGTFFFFLGSSSELLESESEDSCLTIFFLVGFSLGSSLAVQPPLNPWTSVLQASCSCLVRDF